MTFIVSKAKPGDLPLILEVQKAAFKAQGELYGEPGLPPLVQTLDEIIKECDGKTVLKAESDGEIIGSVRVGESGGICRIGRLAVLPEHQGRGVGAALMRAIEACFPNAERFAVFTGHKSLKNQRLYARLGYAETGRERVSDILTLVYMEKPNSAT